MARKDPLKDNDVAQTAFTAAKSPFGWDKAANDVLDNEPGVPSHQRIQEVVATLEHQGRTYRGKLGNMQPAAPTQKAVKAAPVLSPETTD